MEKVTELFVVVENRPGALGELLGHLDKEKINIEAIGLFQDIAKISVSDVDRGMKALLRGNYQVERREVIRINLDNKPGSFAFVVSRLGAAGAGDPDVRFEGGRGVTESARPAHLVTPARQLVQ